MNELKIQRVNPRADLGFFRGAGADFKKVLKTLSTAFFRSTKWVFRALSDRYKNPISTEIVAPQERFWKGARNAVFGHFLENFDQENCLFRRELPFKISIEKFLI